MNRFLPGQSGNPAGRPRKYVSQLKNIGYSLIEINDTLQALLALTKDELTNVQKNSDSTMLEKIVSASMLNALKIGDLMVIETLLTRIYGRPYQGKLIITGEEDGPENLTPQQRLQRLIELASTQPRLEPPDVSGEARIQLSPIAAGDSKSQIS